jgi:hypothetical protein
MKFNIKPLTTLFSLNEMLFPSYPCTIAMVLQVGSRVSFLAFRSLAKHLPGTSKAAIAQQLDVHNITTVEIHGTVVGRLGRPARGLKIAVDGGYGDTSLGTRNMTEIRLALDHSAHHKVAINYCEDEHQTEPELHDEESASSPSDVDEERDRGDVQIQRSAPDGHPRDGPVTAANAKNRKLGKGGGDHD